jgi:hypothetical protein
MLRHTEAGTVMMHASAWKSIPAVWTWTFAGARDHVMADTGVFS